MNENLADTMNIRSLVAILIAAFLAGCGGGYTPPPAPPAPTPMPPPVPLYYDNTGGIRDSIRVVIMEPDSMRKYWRLATSTQVSPPDMPQLDFRSEMAVLVAAGLMTPVDRIQVDSLNVQEVMNAEGRDVETLKIYVSIRTGCREVQTEAFPVAIVRVRRFDGPQVFEIARPPTVCRESDAH